MALISGAAVGLATGIGLCHIARGMAHRFCIAPMMDWTDRHCRLFHRMLTRRARLYTEMITAEAILHGRRDRLLGLDPVEMPVALQLGGAEPHRLADAAAVGESYGYDEINLNVGCPSDRVQGGHFGACLMADPDRVARCVAAMRSRVGVPVTVKCRIGIDDQDGEADLDRFVAAVAAAGCRTFIVHARKAWLRGLSPKQNREIPPLCHARVYRLKATHPNLEIVLNGGIASLEEAKEHLKHVDGVMLGRAAYQTPYILADVDGHIFDEPAPAPVRANVLRALDAHIAAHLTSGGRLNNVTRHVLGLYHGQPRARAFRRFLSENAPAAGADLDILRQAVAIAEGTAVLAVAAE